MKKQSKNRLILIMLLLIISVGFALLSTRLNIVGNSSIKRTTWNIYWNNVQESEGSIEGDNVVQPAHIIGENNNTVEYSVILDTPGDFYEFTVDAVNDSTLDAMIDDFSLDFYDENDDPRELPEYLEYSIKYADDTEVAEEDLLDAGETKTYKVRLEFKQDISEEDLPDEAEVIGLKFSVDYVQATSKVAYTVTHRYEKLDTGYDEVVENLQGMPGTQVTPEVKGRTGFTSPQPQTVTIQADGSTAVTYTYTRNEYTFAITDRTYIDNTSTPDGTYKYGTEIILKAEERQNYNFHWSDGDTNYNRTLTLEDNLSLTPIYELNEYVVTLNPNGGSVSSTTISVTPGEAIGTIPTPTNGNQLFGGWYTNASGGEEVTSETIPTGNMEIFARWFASNIVAVVNDTDGYTTIAAAIAAVTTDGTLTKIKILQDRTETLTVAAGKNIIFDINGKTLNNTSAILLTNNGTIEIKNGTLNDTSKNVLSNTGTMSIKNCTITCSAGSGAVDNNTNGIMTIEDTTITATGSRQGVYNKGGNLTIKDCTISSTASERPAVQNLNDGSTIGTTTILGNTSITSTGYAGLYVEGGSVVIGTKDGTIENSPIIEGKTYGVMAYGTYEFYDGLLKGKTGSVGIAAAQGNTPTVTDDTNHTKITAIEEDSDYLVGTDGDYKTLSLELTGEKYTITLNANGGSVLPTQKSITQGSTIGSLPTPTREGYYSDKWYTDPSGGIEVTSNYIPTGDMEIFARWKKSVQSMTINPNNLGLGTGEQETINITNANEIEEEWSFSSGDTNIAIVDYNGVVTGVAEGTTTITITGLTSGQTKTVPVDVTTRFTINYNANGGEFSNHETTKQITYRSVTKYSHTSNVDDTGKQNSDYGDNWSEKNITGTDRGNTSKAHVVTIPGATSLTVDIYYNGESTNYDWVTVWEGSHPDYTASDDYSSGISGAEQLGNYQSDSYTINGNTLTDMGHKTLTIMGDTVTFGFVSDSGACGNGYGYYAIISNSTTSDNYEDPTNENATFAGWYKDQACSDGQEFYISQNKNSIPVYAKWTYQVIFNANGGSTTESSREIVKGNTIGSLPTPTKENQHFMGWYTRPDGTGEEVTSNYVPYDNIEIFAHWRNLEQYTVTFDKNDNNAIGTMNPQTIIEEISTALTPNNYELSGYAFVGWNTESNGTGTSYLDEADIILTRNITLYAQWIKTYTVTFDKNNIEATGNPYSITKISGTSINITADIFNKYKLTDKIIENYNTESNNSGTAYYRNQSITLNEDKTLYAQWIDVEVTDEIYWAIQNSGKKLVIASYEVAGDNSGSFAGDTEFTSTDELPWEDYDYNVSQIEIEGLVVPKYTTYWFYGVGYNAGTLTANLDNLITSKVTNMSYMFYKTGSRNENFNLVGLDNWDVSNVINMSGMFEEAGQEATTWNIGDLSGWDTSNVTNMSSMFEEAGGYATTWNVEGLNRWNTSKVTDMSNMFANAGSCVKEFTLDLSGWNRNTINVTNMSSMFSNIGKKANTLILDLSGWDTSNVTDMSNMFNGSGINANTHNLVGLDTWNTINVTDMRGMFMTSGKTALTSWDIGDLSGWKTSNVTDMSYMFASINYLKFSTINIYNWNTSNVVDMSGMFRNSGEMIRDFSLDLTNWNTSKVTDMSNMFSKAFYNASDYYLNLSSWDTSNVTDMSGMFAYIGENSGTVRLNISGWNTSKVTNMSGMFVRSAASSRWGATIPRTNGNGLDNTTTILYGSDSSVYITKPYPQYYYASSYFTLASN